MAAENAERLVVGVGGEGRARGAVLLEPDLLALGLVDALGLGAQHGHLVIGEAVLDDDIAVLVEILELGGGELHEHAPWQVLAGGLTAI